MPDRAAAELDALVARYGLSEPARARLQRLARALAEDPRAPTSLRDPLGVVRDHLADALVALELDGVRSAASVLDLGSGAGVPGLPLAIARDGLADVALVEAAGRKCRFLRALIGELELMQVEVLHARAEALARDRSAAWDVVTARAVSSLAVVAEYAAPLLRVGGTLVAWRGQRDPQAELEGQRAAAALGLEPGPIMQVWPHEQAEQRFLHLMLKVRDTPERFPRRAGMAAKRPLGAT